MLTKNSAKLVSKPLVTDIKWNFLEAGKFNEISDKAVFDKTLVSKFSQYCLKWLELGTMVPRKYIALDILL